MRSLVPLLTPEVVIPGDMLIREGEIGREMYLLRRGELEVIAHGHVVATLTSGGFVGEVCLLWEDTKRTASVRAVSFCDVLVLSKEDFDSVVQMFPDVQRRMKMEATMRKNARTLQDKNVADGQGGGGGTGGGGEGEGGGKGELGDRMRRLVRQGSLHQALLRQDSGLAGSTATTPSSTRPTTPSSTSSTGSSSSPFALHSPVGAAQSSALRALRQRPASVVLPAMLDVLSSVRAKEEGDVRRQTMPITNGDGQLQAADVESRGRQKWRKLRLLTKGMS